VLSAPVTLKAQVAVSQVGQVSDDPLMELVHVSLLVTGEMFRHFVATAPIYHHLYLNAKLGNATQNLGKQNSYGRKIIHSFSAVTYEQG
jgi:hypothetical protein